MWQLRRGCLPSVPPAIVLWVWLQARAALFSVQCKKSFYKDFFILTTPFPYLYRCSSTTCAICSRTCTHSVTSQPPTPQLTWSPTPSPPLAPSPRRSVLALNSPNTNTGLRPVDQSPLTPTQVSLAGKRRKIVDPDGYESDLSHLKHLKDVPSSGDGGIDRQDHDLLQDLLSIGCGRLVCRRCCYEDIPKCVYRFILNTLPYFSLQ